jgi:NADH:ubiquinone reductase (H+-translocating)
MATVMSERVGTPSASASGGAGRRPRVVILGGGFAGYTAAKRLKHAPVDITLVDRTNHHLFQPLLYQVALATLNPGDIAVPIRWLLRHHKNTEVLMADATSIDPERRVVTLDGQDDLPYDYLIVATGSRHSYFGHGEWEAIAPGLKSLDDAVTIRNRFLVAFEEAERVDDPVERQAYLTFVIVGGGPTGVELAGFIPDIARHALRPDFRRANVLDTKVLLLEAGPRVLPSFPESLSAKARADLERLGVRVRTGAMVTRVEDDAVEIGDERIPTRTIFWAAGNAASPLARSLGAPLDRQGRVLVAPDLSVPGRPEILIAGDLAAVKDKHGEWVPGVAPAANQMGWDAGGAVLASVQGQPRKPFKYFDKGNLATIGRHEAIAHVGPLKLNGHLAWFMWLFIHILYLAGFRNRVTVLVQWAYAYLTWQRGVRIIANYSAHVPAEKTVQAAGRG